MNQSSTGATPLYEARAVIKRFGHVTALDGADFTVYPGEVVALVGDNGAGKSTLVKTLSGALQPDEGELLFNGEAGLAALAARRARARHRDRLPGSRARSRPRPGDERVPRARGHAARRAREARVPRPQDHAPQDGGGLHEPRRRRALDDRARRHALGRPAPGRCRQPCRHVGEQGHLPRRADGSARRRADARRARADPQGARHRLRGRADQPQHARGARGLGPHRGAAARPARGEPARRRHRRWRRSSAR